MLEIVWNKDCEIGIDLIDQQHHKLVNILNDLAIQIEGLKSNKQVNEELMHIADELEAYTKTHFSDEEKMYLDLGKDITEHVKLHKKFTNDLAEVKEVLEHVQSDSDVANLLSVYRGLLTWFMNHIKEDDKDFWN